ncbi:MAG: hypothetical protein KGQ52_03260 [Alphaproteobacteria bacterium]|nr:hypothetical protein [Alphaproteobacteria bacterium]
MANPLARLAVRAAAAAASRQIAARVKGADLGPIGTVAAVALPFALRRVSPLGLAAMAVGAWGLGQLARSAAAAPAAAATPVPPAPARAPIVTPPPIAWAAASDGY